MTPPPAAPAVDQRSLAEALIHTHSVRGSRLVSRAMLALALIGLPFCVLVGIFSVRLAVTMVALAVSVIAYQSFLLRLYRRGKYRRWIDWVNATLEVSLPTLIMLADVHFIGPAYALTSSQTLLYGVAILLSAVRLRRALCLYTSVLAAGSAFAIYVWQRGALPADLVARLPSLTLFNVALRSSLLLLAGVVAYWVCASLRTLVDDLLTSLRQEFRVRSTLDRHVSPSVADALLSSGEDGLSESRDISILFADIRGFTRFCEGRSPAEVTAFLNDYFEIAERVVEREAGVINKFLGDGLMALFGAPVRAEDHAQRAARVALALVASLDALRTRWNLPELRIGVALHCGATLVGTVGSQRRMEYTAIGDPVNVAARIEGLNAIYQTTILMSRELRDRLGSAAEVRRVDEAHVKGRDEPVEVFELIALAAGPARFP